MQGPSIIKSNITSRRWQGRRHWHCSWRLWFLTLCNSGGRFRFADAIPLDADSKQVQDDYACLHYESVDGEDQPDVVILSKILTRAGAPDIENVEEKLQISALGNAKTRCSSLNSDTYSPGSRSEKYDLQECHQGCTWWKAVLDLYITADVKNRLRAENPELNDAKYWRRAAARDGRRSKKQRMD